MNDQEQRKDHKYVEFLRAPISSDCEVLVFIRGPLSSEAVDRFLAYLDAALPHWAEVKVQEASDAKMP